jgi:hypothetical protein
LGVCQYYFGKTPCARCQAKAVEVERRVTPAPDPAPLPTYAFAPGVLEHTDPGDEGFYNDSVPLTFGELILLLFMAFLLSASLFGVAGYLVGRFV